MTMHSLVNEIALPDWCRFDCEHGIINLTHSHCRRCAHKMWPLPMGVEIMYCKSWGIGMDSS